MNRIKVGAASINQTPMDWGGNLSRIRKAIEEADKKDVNILCLPELSITGYGCEDMFHSPHVQTKALDMLVKVSKSSELPADMTVLVGLPIKYQNSLFNCVAVVQKDNIKGLVPKHNMAQDGVHYEPRWFQSWKRDRQHVILIDDEKVPFGDLVFDMEGIRFGFEICEDAWVAGRLTGDLAQRGVDIIFNPSASHFAFGKQKTRREIVRSGSRSTSCAYVYCNTLGNESGKIIYDGSRIIASRGEIVAEGSRFSMREVELTEAVVDIDALRAERTDREGFAPREGNTVFMSGPTTTTEAPTKPITPETLSKEKEFEQAVTLGLFDYMSKSDVNGFCVSLSGGADSSATAILVRMMIKRVNTELSPTELMGRGNFLNTVGHFGLTQRTTEDILTCFYQPTRNSSETTRKAAEAVASEIGAKYLEIDVDAIVEQYKDVVGKGLGVEWDWDEHDITLQNVQARTRGPSAWMVANVENKILLATANRSEAAVGYATMDGDTCGGLAPIGGVDKVFLRKWLRQKEQDFPALKLVNEQQPTPELTPDGDQTDEEDLMPYEVLNRIEHLVVHDKKAPAEVLDLIHHEYDVDTNTAFEWVERFFQLWSQNQWKRERYAPGFHLDVKSLDPKGWCRFPILSSGFKEELEEIRATIEAAKAAANFTSNREQDE